MFFPTRRARRLGADERAARPIAPSAQNASVAVKSDERMWPVRVSSGATRADALRRGP